VVIAHQICNLAKGGKLAFYNAFITFPGLEHLNQRAIFDAGHRDFAHVLLQRLMEVFNLLHQIVLSLSVLPAAPATGTAPPQR